jgi:hypothetical protein
VNFTIAIFVAVIACLLLLLAWAVRRPRKEKWHTDTSASLEQVGRRHSTYLPLVRQALAPADFSFLESRGCARLADLLRKQRRRIALSYLDCLHDDFVRLLHLARAVAALAPQVTTAQELERLWLSVRFECRYQMLRAGIYVGVPSLPILDGLSHMVSDLSVRMETALSELGEQAAIAAKLASSLDRRGVDAV